MSIIKVTKIEPGMVRIQVFLNGEEYYRYYTNTYNQAMTKARERTHHMIATWNCTTVDIISA